MLQAHLKACPGFAAISVDEKKIEFLLSVFFFFFNWRNVIGMIAQLYYFFFLFFLARDFFYKISQILTEVTVKFKVCEKFAEFHHPFAHLSVTSESFSA